MPRFVSLAISVLLFTTLLVSPYQIPAQEKQSSFSAIQGPRPKAIRPFRSGPSANARRWANSQLHRMSLDEKIGQLISIGLNGVYLSQESDTYRALRHQIEDNHVGGIALFAGSVYESVHLVNRMQTLSRLPLLVSADMEFGAGMRFSDTTSLPWNMAVAATGDPKYARRQGEIIADEARALGVRQVFGPVVDVNNNSANPIINVRAYGENPQQVANFSASFIAGAQQHGVVATAKHFPGHGDTAIDSHRGLPVIDLDRTRLDRIELVPFRAAIAVGVGSIMASFIALPKIDPTVIKPLTQERSAGPSEVVQGGEILSQGATLPAALSPLVLQELLRNELHFNGLVVTDALDMSGLTIYFNQDEAAVRAVEAGADVLVKPSDPDAAIRGLRRALDSGRIKESRIDFSVRRILTTKYDLGLVNDRVTPLDRIDQSLSSPAVSAFAREVANHAITLVRDDTKQIPLRLAAGSKIVNLVITNGEDRRFIASPFIDEMSRNGIGLTTVALDGRSSEEEILDAFKQAKNADLVIASLYGRVRAGESGSVGLPAGPAKALMELLKGKTPVVGISFGNPYLLGSFTAMQTYVVAYGDMPSLQQAAADALVGQIDITGRLPITLSSTYARGTGIQVKRKTLTSRWAYDPRVCCEPPRQTPVRMDDR